MACRFKDRAVSWQAGRLAAGPEALGDLMTTGLLVVRHGTGQVTARFHRWVDAVAAVAAVDVVDVVDVVDAVAA